MLSMTDKAAVKARELFEQKGVTEGGLRVFVVGGGCSGYQYGMALAREFDDEDLVVEHSGIKLVVDPDSAPLLEGAEIDYVDDLMKAASRSTTRTRSNPVPAARRSRRPRAAGKRGLAATSHQPPDQTTIRTPVPKGIGAFRFLE